MNDSKRQIQYGAALSYAAVALNIISGLLFTPWMIQKIGQNQYGLYTLANTLITLFLTDFGLSSATARYVSEYHAGGEEEKVHNFLGVVYKLYFVIDLLICAALVVTYFLIDRIYVALTPEELVRFKVVYLIAAGFSVLNFPFVTLNGILTAYEKFIQLKLADVIYRISLVATMIVVLSAGGGLYAVVAVHAAVGILVVVYKQIVIRKTTTVRVNLRFSDRALYRDIFGFSFWSTVVALSQRLIFNITPTILGLFCNSAAIAVFGIVMTIEGYFYTISSTINGMFMPRIAKIYTEDRFEEKLNRLMLSIGRYQYALNGLLVVGFAIVGREFIQLWMGSAYSDAYWGILLVIIPGLFYNSLQIANTATVVKKLVKYNAYINTAIGIVNVLLSVFLSRYYGVIGACCSIFAAYTIRTVLLLILYRKKLAINIKQFVKRCYLKMGIPMIIVVVLGMGINRLLPEAGWGMLLLKAFFIGMIYLGIVGAMNYKDAKKLIEKLK